MISKKEKIEKIINHTQKNKIKAYEIAKNTKLTEAGVSKILKKSSKNPRDLTVDEIYNYLFKNKEEHFSKIEDEQQGSEKITFVKDNIKINLDEIIAFLISNVKKLNNEGKLDSLIEAINYVKNNNKLNDEINGIKELIERNKDILK